MHPTCAKPNHEPNQPDHDHPNYDPNPLIHVPAPNHEPHPNHDPNLLAHDLNLS